jgi:hypothetical protein
MAVSGMLTRVMMLSDPEGDWLRMSLEINFAPASIEAHGVLTDVTNFDEGFATIELTRFRTRKPDGSDQTHVIPRSDFNSASLFADKCTSVTFHAEAFCWDMRAVPVVTFFD